MKRGREKEERKKEREGVERREDGRRGKVGRRR